MKLLSDKRKLKKESETAKRKKEELMQELKEVQKSLDRAYENFSYVVDPELGTIAIFFFVLIDIALYLPRRHGRLLTVYRIPAGNTRPFRYCARRILPLRMAATVLASVSVPSMH